MQGGRRKGVLKGSFPLLLLWSSINLIYNIFQKVCWQFFLPNSSRFFGNINKQTKYIGVYFFFREIESTYIYVRRIYILHILFFFLYYMKKNSDLSRYIVKEQIFMSLVYIFYTLWNQVNVAALLSQLLLPFTQMNPLFFLYYCYNIQFCLFYILSLCA